jgi:hypothetical protein
MIRWTAATELLGKVNGMDHEFIGINVLPAHSPKSFNVFVKSFLALVYGTLLPAGLYGELH